MKVAIFPAGRSALKIYEIIKNIRGEEVEVCCFVDNNANKIGTTINGINVVSTYVLAQMVRCRKIEKVLVTSDNAISYFLDDLIRELESLNIYEYSIIPAMYTRKELCNEDYTMLKGIIFGENRYINQLQHLQFL